MTEKEIRLSLNGRPRTFRVPASQLLINLLREDLGLTGTKYGCGIGECGGCMVLVDGEPALSCLTLAIGLDGREVTTIEGLGPDGGLDPVQEAFLQESALQCGFCTPGMVLTARTLLNHNPNPGEEEIRQYMRGNICRCTGYTSIVRAVQACTLAGAKRKAR